jgi:flavin reductase (DIM6/NTAB) family NADH-FMN oxidoreductase RutF
VSASVDPTTTVSGGSASFSSRDLRDVLGAFPTGVTVITTQGEDHAYGMTANAFSSVSLDPPLVLVCVIKGTEGAENIQRNGCFAVNVLDLQQEAISRYFASKERPRGRDAFKEIAHSRAHTGSPVLDGSVCFLDCRLYASHEAGDHIIFLGEVLEIGVDPQATPILFHRGKYRQMAQDPPN